MSNKKQKQGGTRIPHPNSKQGTSKANKMNKFRFLKCLEVGSYILLMILALIALELPRPFGQITQIGVLIILVAMEIYIRSQKKKLLQMIEENVQTQNTETAQKQ